MGCLKKILNNPIVKPLADVAAIATGNPELIPIINAGITTAGGVANGQSFGKSLGQGAVSGAESFAGQELLPVAGNAFASAFPDTAASLGVTGGSNTLTDFLGQTTGGGSLTGAGTLGGDILGATNAAGLTDSAGGVSSMLSRALSSGGDASGLSGGETSLAPSVTGGTTNAAPLTGGGSSGGVPANTLASPTLAGTGGGASSYSAPGVGNVSPDISTADPSLTSKLPWQTSNYSGVGTVPSTGITSATDSLGLTTPNAATAGTYNFDINGNPTGAASYSAPTQLADATSSAISPGNASAVTSATSGGLKMPSGLGMLGTLLSGANTLRTNNQAQDALTKAQNNAMSVLQPYLATGAGANTQLSNLLGTSGNTGAAGYGTLGQPFTPGDLTKTPGYNFALDQGNQELDRQNAARGGYFSGGAIKAGQNFAQNLASTTYQQQLQDYLAQQQQQYGMLAGQSGAGANAAGAAGNIYGNIGSAKANALVANNGALGSTLGSLLGSGKTPINIGGQLVYV